MDKTLAPQKTSNPTVTECSQSSLSFARHFRRQVSAQFDGGVISSDGGALRGGAGADRGADPEAWPQVRIIVRGDSGFCRDELMSWCEEKGVDYVLGLARNERLREMIAEQMGAAAERQQRTGKPARVFTEFEYQTRRSWSRARRVVAKAEQLAVKENPR